jgi:hypothetical protein
VSVEVEELRKALQEIAGYRGGDHGKSIARSLLAKLEGGVGTFPKRERMTDDELAALATLVEKELASRPDEPYAASVPYVEREAWMIPSREMLGILEHLNGIGTARLKEAERHARLKPGETSTGVWSAEDGHALPEPSM